MSAEFHVYNGSIHGEPYEHSLVGSLIRHVTCMDFRVLNQLCIPRKNSYQQDFEFCSWYLTYCFPIDIYAGCDFLLILNCLSHLLQVCHQTIRTRVSEIVQWVKVLAANTDDLSSIPGTELTITSCLLCTVGSMSSSLIPKHIKQTNVPKN